MGYTLITNDDGVDSPALPPLVRALAALGPVRTVVPSGERSWISKAISRWTELRVEQVEREGIEIYTVDGFPADCTNLGVHSLFDEPPEMVVSGINLGLNMGLGFFLSSGTVGAAMEGWIAGLPALAFSIGTVENDRDWKSDIRSDRLASVWPRAAELSADIVRIVREAGYPRDVDLLNINFTLEANVHTERMVTDLAVVGYGQLFQRRDAGLFMHDYRGGLEERAPLDGTDVAVLRQGRVSITPVRLAHAAKLPAGLRHRFESPRS